MVKNFCDICGKEICNSFAATRYKVKKQRIHFGDSWYEKLHVHDDCWLDMCRYIRDRREENEKAK